MSGRRATRPTPALRPCAMSVARTPDDPTTMPRMRHRGPVGALLSVALILSVPLGARGATPRQASRTQDVDWRQGSFDAARHGFNRFESILGTSTVQDLQEQWAVPAGWHSTPALVDGVVYVGSWDGSVSAIDASTGSVLWKQQFDTCCAVWGPVVAEDLVFAATPGVLVALDVAT